MQTLSPFAAKIIHRKDVDEGRVIPPNMGSLERLQLVQNQRRRAAFEISKCGDFYQKMQFESVYSLCVASQHLRYIRRESIELLLYGQRTGS